MSKLNQVIQMGEIKGHVHYYIEDYAYTYLKKQKGKENTKFFLYGERETEESIEKIYIYGIGEKPKLEQSYFKEYYPVGYLKIKDEKAYWISLKGIEEEIVGCYIFYASNHAMQEYLMDHRQEETSEKEGVQKKRRLVENEMAMKEIRVSARKVKARKSKEEFKNEKFILPIGGIAVAVITLMVLLSPNGREKAEIMKEVISKTVSEMGVSVEDDFTIEEKPIMQEENYIEETLSTDSVWEVEEKTEVMEEVEKKQQNEVIEETVIETKESADKTTDVIEEPIEKVETQELEEYIVKDGDTLVGICKIDMEPLQK